VLTLYLPVAYPLDLVRRRLQAQGARGYSGEQYAGAIDCLRKTISRGGYRGLYSGMVPNILKVVPAVSVSYLVFERTKNYLAAV
jgi:solute carrier family 25 phosphate transporter 23/24/25/41